MSSDFQRMVKEFDDKMQSYYDKVFPEFMSYIENKRRPYKPLLDAIFNFYLFGSYLVDSGLFSKATPSHNCLGTLYAKSFLGLFAIHNCLSNGCISEAAILLRGIFESYVNTKVMLESDTSARIKLYMDYRYVEKWQNLQANRKLLKEGIIQQSDFDKQFSAESIALIETHYNNVKEDYHPKSPFHWAWKIYSQELRGKNPSLKFICEKLGNQVDYVRAYSGLSILAHAGPLTYNLMTIGNRTTISPIFTDTIRLIGCIAIGYCRKIVEMVTSYLKFQNPEDISLYTENFFLSVCGPPNASGGNQFTKQDFYGK